uniref:Immunoglobulin V-set domain-containing protein n=1 Tax=Bos mutus grunniens TaxID=30521 RepID=A0A8B9X1S5_BOSMU
EVQLREWGPSLVKPSQTLSLTFMVSGFSLTSYGVDWVRQAPGKGLEQMACINYDGDTYYSPSIKSHTSISETSKNQFSLQLSCVTTEDMAVCCCARDTVRGRHRTSTPA